MTPRPNSRLDEKVYKPQTEYQENSKIYDADKHNFSSVRKYDPFFTEKNNSDY